MFHLRIDSLKFFIGHNSFKEFLKTQFLTFYVWYYSTYKKQNHELLKSNLLLRWIFSTSYSIITVTWAPSSLKFQVFIVIIFFWQSLCCNEWNCWVKLPAGETPSCPGQAAVWPCVVVRIRHQKQRQTWLCKISTKAKLHRPF